MSARSAALGGVAALALAAMSLLRLWAQSYAMYGAGGAMALGNVSTTVLHTTWGLTWRVQILAAVAALLGFVLVGARARLGWIVASAASVLLAFTPALAGHAAASPRYTVPAILLDGIHVLAAGGWMGTLFCVLTVGVATALSDAPEDRGRATAALVNAFSPVALVCAGVAAATGVVTAAIHLGGLTALWQSEYGETLLVKLGVLSLVAAMGAYNWQRAKPAIGGDGGVARIRRSATVELVFGTLVLLVTAVLVATPPPDAGSDMRRTSSPASLGEHVEGARP